MSIPEVGEPAPAFSLAGTVVRDGTRTDGVYDLSAQIGRTVVLAFFWPPWNTLAMLPLLLRRRTAHA